MASITADRDAIKARLVAAIASGVAWHDVWPSSQVDTPAGLIKPLELPDREIIGGGDFYRRTYEILFLAHPIQNGVARAQDALDPYLATSGASSIRAAIEGDRTLGGVVSWVHLQPATDYGGFEVGGIEYLGARMVLEVWGS